MESSPISLSDLQEEEFIVDNENEEVRQSNNPNHHPQSSLSPSFTW